MRFAPPGRPSRRVLAVAAATWAGVLAGGAVGWAIALAALPVVARPVRRRAQVVLVLVALAAGGLAGAAGAARAASILSAELPAGRVVVEGAAAGDPVTGRYGTVLVLRPRRIGETEGGRLPPVLLELDDPSGIEAGQRVRAEGVLEPGGLLVRGDPVAGILHRARVTDLAPPAALHVRLGNAVRRWILAGVRPDRSAGRALVAGFLVGDTSGLPAVDVDRLRRAGLSHFVAVSGSNVALFLALWWILLAPVAGSPRRRWLPGLAGLLLFAVVTRWEPSVVRAAASVAVLSTARRFGVPLDGWSALGAAVTTCLLLDGSLATEIGFALSVAATAGVMAGARMFRFRPAWLATVLGSTVAAQLAVAPLLVPVFGSVPLAAPLANAAAAPLVTVATAVGGIGGILHAGPLVSVGERVADLVLAIGAWASPLPQAGWSALAWGGVLLAVVRFPVLRPVAFAGAVALGVHALAPVVPPARPAVAFLDVGQGDAELVLGSSITVLVDGGPDPVVLDRALDEYGVEEIDLVVATHVHEDHLRGLVGAIGRRPIGALWQAFEPHETGASVDLIDAARTAGIPVSRPDPGSRIDAGDVTITVLGPVRRFASPNDQSLVLLVEMDGLRVLLPGDLEVPGQRTLGPIAADVLKVPHQGAATSDPRWLEGVGASIAIVSVGPNDYGHPSPDVEALLATSGARVLRTDRDGTVLVSPPDPP